MNMKQNTVCSSCGANFTCGIKAGENTCWCFELPNVMPLTPDDESAPGCLCPKCLEARIIARMNDNKQETEA